MIRTVNEYDAEEIRDIYNYYILNTAISFETEAIGGEEMHRRIREISGRHPYFVCEEDGKVQGYCYAHQWKSREAYSHTLETTVYIAPAYTRLGIGRLLMSSLIDACRERGVIALIACITEGNEASIGLHKALGFKQVSHYSQVGIKFGRRLDVIDLELLL